MKIILCFTTLLFLFANTAIGDGYTTNQHNYNDPYYYPPYTDEGVILTPVNPNYQDPSTISPRSIITIPNPPTYPTYPTYPNYPTYPTYPDYPDYSYSTYPITFDRGSSYYSGLSTYYVGENVQINLTAVDHGTLYLFVVDPNGSVRQLLPNYASSAYSYPVTSGRSYRIPEYGARYKLRAVEPRGYHKLIGFLVASYYGSYSSYDPYGSSYGSYDSDLFSGVYSESDLLSRVDNLRHNNSLRVYRYEGQLIVQ